MLYLTKKFNDKTIKSTINCLNSYLFCCQTFVMCNIELFNHVQYICHAYVQHKNSSHGNTI